MLKRYVYKNVRNQTVNIGGYRFEKGQELESDIKINGFSEAVSNGFLELIERSPQGEEPDATQASQMSNTGKVKVIFHMGLGPEGEEILKEIEMDPSTPINFSNEDLIDLRKDEAFEGWFKDADFAKPMNLDKAKARKEGDLHIYGKYRVIQEEDALPVNPNGEEQQAVFPPLPPPSVIDDRIVPKDSKNS